MCAPTDSRLQTLDSRLQTPDSRLQTPDSIAEPIGSAGGIGNGSAEIVVLHPNLPVTRARPPDLLFEAVAEVCGIDRHELTKTGRGSLNAAVGLLRSLKPPPEPAEVARRAAHYQQRWDTPLTPPALAKHWAECAGPVQRKAQGTNRSLANGASWAANRQASQ